jgi:hypothetical protein
MQNHYEFFLVKKVWASPTLKPRLKLYLSRIYPTGVF